MKPFIHLNQRKCHFIKVATYQKGISLVEIMVAMVIDILLLILITAYIIQQSNMRSELEKTTMQMENGRYAMFVLQQDLNHAGYYGPWEPPIVSMSGFSDPCVTNPETPDISSDAYNANISLVFPVSGYNNPSTIPSCLPDHKTGTDILVVRRVDTAGPITSPTPNEIYLQSTSTSEASPFDRNLGIQNADLQNGNPTNFQLGSFTSSDCVDEGTTADGNPVTIKKKAPLTSPPRADYKCYIAADIYKYHVQIYFISPCSVPTGSASDPAGLNKVCQSSDDNGSPIPTLKRMELSSVAGTRQFKEVPLVEGIENLQIDYGVDTDLDGSPDGSFTVSPSATDWTNIVVVKLNILSRNVERTSTCPTSNPPAYCTNVFNLGLHGNVGPFTDGYKRHVYTESVLLVNPVKRRQQ